VQLAGTDAAQAVEGVLGGLLVAAVLAIAVVQGIRWWRGRTREHDEPGVPALARFADTETTDLLSFGGGAWSARVLRRRDTVTYGYLAVAEEYASADSGGRWCTLSVSLPGRVPFLVLDNRAAVGRTGVPADLPQHVELDDPPFDALYTVGAGDPGVPSRVLGPAAREVLVRAPVQRLMLSESQLLLRTFDGVSLDEEVIAALDGIAARFLASTPSFVTPSRAHAGRGSPPSPADEPLPEGFYGPDEPGA
jgi:hypothetical protein